MDFVERGSFLITDRAQLWAAPVGIRVLGGEEAVNGHRVQGIACARVDVFLPHLRLQGM